MSDTLRNSRRAVVVRSLTLFLLCVVLGPLGGCSGSREVTDALRIRADREGDYQRVPNSDIRRDGRTLRGTVYGVVITPPQDAAGRPDTQYVFRDVRAPDRAASYEKIPIADVERIGDLMTLPPDTVLNNINLVESFNNTQMIPELRRVPVFTPNGRADNTDPGGGGGAECNCMPFGFSIPIPGIDCPERNYSLIFVELRGSYGSYTDVPRQGVDVGRAGYVGEVAAGVRFGGADEWGLGALYNTGLASSNSFDGSRSTRPLVLAHLRYQSPGPVTGIFGICMKPFVYGEFGAAVDHATINLVKMNLGSTEDCNCGEIIDELDAEGDLPGVDLGMPLTFGIGIGVDIPVASFLDASVDVGYRSIGIGEEAALAGFKNIPSLRRVGAFFFRLGVTY